MKEDRLTGLALTAMNKNMFNITLHHFFVQFNPNSFFRRFSGHNLR